MRAPISVFLATMAVSLACGGTQDRPVETVVPAAEPATPAVEDQRIELDAQALTGMRFVPEALGAPPLPSVKKGRPPSLAVARRRASRKNARPEQVHLFAIVAWGKAREMEDAAAAEELRSEVRSALEKLSDRLGDDVDAMTLELAATTAMWQADYDAAASAYATLAERFADHAGAASFRMWHAYALLRQGKTRDAADLLGGVSLTDADPMTAYVLAWTAHRRGDAAGARAAIAAAMTSWPTEATLANVERDLLLFLARGGAPLAEAVKIFEALAQGDAKKAYVWTFKLSEGYKFAGYYGLASESLEHNLATGAAPPEDVVGFRFRQADYAFRNNAAARAAEHAIAAHRALPDCGETCAGETAQAVAQRITRLAQFFHTSYAASFDTSHHDAARALYEYYVSLPGREDTEIVQGYLSNLEDTRENANPANGKHSEQIVGNMIAARREAVSACYEAELGREPGLEGAVQLTLEIAQDGVVQGAVSDPPEGAEGLPAVGACLTRRARTWSFPSRTVPGVTKVVASWSFSPGAQTP